MAKSNLKPIGGASNERCGHTATAHAGHQGTDGGVVCTAPLRTGGQAAETSYHPEVSASEAKLVLGNGEPRLWIMHLPHVGLGFTRIARHRRVTQCLGSLGGKEWLIGVAPPGDLGDDARPRIEDIAAFRVPGDRLIKLHVATWHAGPHFVHDECLFVNLENLDTNRRDFHGRFQSSAGIGSESR